MRKMRTGKHDYSKILEAEVIFLRFLHIEDWKSMEKHVIFP